MYHTTLQWRHNGRDGVSNYQPHECLRNRLFRRWSKETTRFRVTGLCQGNSPVTSEFPAQEASDAENASIWWRHLVNRFLGVITIDFCWSRVGGQISFKVWLNTVKMMKSVSRWRWVWRYQTLQCTVNYLEWLDLWRGPGLPVHMKMRQWDNLKICEESLKTQKARLIWVTTYKFPDFF